MKNIYDLDDTALQIMRLTVKSEITITSYGETHTFRFAEKPNENEGFELYDIKNDSLEYKLNDKYVVYSLSCNSLTEVIGVLLQDYANGNISKVENVHIPS